MSADPWVYKRPFIMNKDGVAIGRILTRPNDARNNFDEDDERGRCLAENINAVAELVRLANRVCSEYRRRPAVPTDRMTRLDVAIERLCEAVAPAEAIKVIQERGER